MGKLLFDIQYAIRILLKRPLFTAATIGIMAIGLGLSIYTYSLLNTLLYKPLDIKNGESLVAITGKYNQDFRWVNNVQDYVAREIREHTQSFDEFAVHIKTGGTALLSGRDRVAAAQKVNSSFAEWRLFNLAGVTPLMGRVLQKEDHAQGAEPVIVLGYATWKHYFSGDSNIIDKLILVDATSTRVVGVMPEGFAFPSHAQAWQPIRYRSIAAAEFWRGSVNVIARLKPSVSIRQANADVARVTQRLKTEYPDYADYIDSVVKPYKQEGLEKKAPLLLSMAAIVVLILLLSCLNVGNLLLVRVNQRCKEIAVRVALGVPRYRLIMQMLWEGIIICSIGGVLAILFAAWGLEITNNLIDVMYGPKQDKPFWWELELDVDTVMVLMAVIGVTVLITSVFPVLRATKGNFNAVLRDGTRGAHGQGSAYFSNLLVMGEILLSCVVLVITAMMITMTVKAANVNYGVDTSNILTGAMELPVATYPRDDMESKIRFYNRVRYEMEKEPNIKNFMSMSTVPGTGMGWQYVAVKGREYPSMESHPKSYSVGVLNGSMQAFDIALIEGRYFNESDTAEQAHRVVISQSLAKELFSSESALGKSLRVYQMGVAQQSSQWMSIIGVVEDVTYGSVINATEMTKTYYFSNNQSGIGSRFFVSVRYSGSESRARESMKNALKRADPDIPIYDLRSYDRLLKEPLYLISNMSKLFSICGLMAILLAASGIYAVISNSVSMRMQEIGLRRALGATDGSILNLFLKKSVGQLVLGIGFGLIGAISLTLLMADYMAVHLLAYVIAYIGVPVLIVIVVLFATFIPTKQAITGEPADALYYE